MPRLWTAARHGPRLLLLIALGAATAGCDDLLGGVGLGGRPGSGPVPADDLAGVQAFGSVIQSADGTVQARLDVLTLAGEPRFLSGITDPTLTVGTTEVPLLTGATVGVFETNSRRSPALVYAPEATYLFSFTVVDDEGDEHVYRSYARAPSRDPIVDIAEFPFRAAGEPIEISLTGMADGGVIRVVGPSEVTFDTTAVSSIADVHLIRPAMERNTGPELTIPGTAFAKAGTYRIEVTSLGLRDAAPTSTDEDVLGSVSWFAAGATVAASVSVD